MRLTIFGQTAFSCLIGMVVSIVSVHIAGSVGWVIMAAIFVFLGFWDAYDVRVRREDDVE